MNKSMNYFSKMLSALLMCLGLVMISCEGADTIGEGDNTGQDGYENNGNGGGENCPATLNLSKITAATATFIGHLDVPASDLSFSQVTVYYSDAKVFNMNAAESISVVTFDSEQNFTLTLTDLEYNTKYNYCMVVEVKSEKTYGDVQNFTTKSIAVELSVKETQIVSSEPVAEFEGSVTGLSSEDKDYIKVGVAYSSVSEELKSDKSKKIYVTEYASDDSFTIVSENLLPCTSYYCCCFIKTGETYNYFDVKEFQTLLDVSSATDLSSSASANCYIVSNSGLYKFKTVKGNSATSVGNISSVSILWETFGTSRVPFDLIDCVCYKDSYIVFQTSKFKEGNAVIAAKDDGGKILWSWHIWLTDQPQEHVYGNNVGTMMDRNLGATSATPGEVGALGLLYQWGRKDPFLGSSSISVEIEAVSTIAWPEPVISDSKSGTIDYATSNPTTYIISNSLNQDWYYTGTRSTEHTRWTTSEAAKSIYDPCPPGWRVPDGGFDGVWFKAGFENSTYDSTNEGVSFSNSSPSAAWYPASGYRGSSNGRLYLCYKSGYYWSASCSGDLYSPNCAYNFEFDDIYGVFPIGHSNHGLGFSVRCHQE